MPNENVNALGYYPEAELVFGIVSAIGVEYRPVVETLKNYLEQFGYFSQEVKLSQYFEELALQLGITVTAPASTSNKLTMWRKIQLGNAICKTLGSEASLALLATSVIESTRERSDDKTNRQSEALPKPKTAHIVVSVKRPEEVSTLRRIYGPGFFLIGIASNDEERRTYFEERDFEDDEQSELIEIDAAENESFGQQTRDTFYLSDCFISLERHSQQTARFLDLVFGNPFLTPTLEERSMYMAYAASLSSGDLARQVGAAVIDSVGDCLGLGWNEVPRPGGGLYGPEGHPSRDMELKEDSNDSEKMKMAVAILQKLDNTLSTEDAKANAKERLRGTGFFDITEFGRAVHAEMAAILACARTGRSTIGGTLFVTTFPCHNCTRHIIASGLKRVFYIEPYVKSKALKLHGDSCTEDRRDSKKIPFLPFIGVGPRRYLDLFSMSLGTGYPLERKRDGKKLDWERATATPRLQMQPVSYLFREGLASTTLDNLLSVAKQSLNVSGATHEAAGTESLESDQSSC